MAKDQTTEIPCYRYLGLLACPGTHSPLCCKSGRQPAADGRIGREEAARWHPNVAIYARGLLYSGDGALTLDDARKIIRHYANQHETSGGYSLIPDKIRADDSDAC